MVPRIVDARETERVQIDDSEAVLYEDVVASGLVQYLYVVRVTRKGEEQAWLYVTSEVNRMAGELGGGSHFLCLFTDRGHLNLGSSNDWADRENFRRRALEEIGRRI